jgi:Na+/H+ antiporter NhaC
MNIILNAIPVTLLLLILYRIFLLNKDKKQLKRDLQKQHDSEKQKKYRQTVIAQVVVFLIWILVLIYYVWLFYM